MCRLSPVRRDLSGTSESVNMSILWKNPAAASRDGILRSWGCLGYLIQLASLARESAFVKKLQISTTFERSGRPARRRLSFIGSQNPNQTKSTQKGAFCAFCLVGLDGLEPSECHSQSVVPYHLATAQYKEKRLFVEVFFLSGVGSGIRTHDLQCHKLTR